LYEVLGIDKDSTVSEIKKAYYREAKNAHPDKHQGNAEMLEKFQKVAEAYSTLADPVRRSQYDLQGLAGLATMNYNVNASRLFGPPPWRVLIGKTNHWLWEPEKEESMIGLLVASIPNGIAGVTMKTLEDAYARAMENGVAILLDRVSQPQAEDAVEALEEYGIAVKAEAIEGERTNEKESPLMYFRRIQRDLGEASEQLRMAALEIPAGDNPDGELDEIMIVVRGLRSELRAAAKELEEFKDEQKGAQRAAAQEQQAASGGASAPAEPKGPPKETWEERVEKAQVAKAAAEKAAAAAEKDAPPKEEKKVREKYVAPGSKKAAAAPAKEEKKAAKAPAPEQKAKAEKKKEEKKPPKGDIKDLLLEKER